MKTICRILSVALWPTRTFYAVGFVDTCAVLATLLVLADVNLRLVIERTNTEAAQIGRAASQKGKPWKPVVVKVSL